MDFMYLCTENNTMNWSSRQPTVNTTLPAEGLASTNRNNIHMYNWHLQSQLVIIWCTVLVLLRCTSAAIVLNGVLLLDMQLQHFWRPNISILCMTWWHYPPQPCWQTEKSTSICIECLTEYEKYERLTVSSLVSRHSIQYRARPWVLYNFQTCLHSYLTN
jgi:hypothetical protein